MDTERRVRGVTARHGRRRGLARGTAEPLERRTFLAASPVQLTDFLPTTTADAFPTGLTAFGGSLYFAAQVGAHAGNIFRTDGTAAGTSLVKELPKPIDQFPRDFTVAGGYLYFTTGWQSDSTHLWRTDGTADGTILLKDFPAEHASHVRNLTEVGGGIYFSVKRYFTNELEVWKSDGTPGGTTLVKGGFSEATSPGSDPIGDFAELGGTLLFRAGDGVHGHELWASDGTAEGTTLVKDIYDGATGGEPGRFTRVGDVLYFSAADAAHGRELWKTDGTPGGTMLVKDVNPFGANSSYPGSLAALGTTLYFAADFGFGVSKLWKTDGTDAGTVPVDGDPFDTFGAQYPAGLTVLDGQIYFTAYDPGHGRQLWKTDGTPQGTSLISTIAPSIDTGISLFTVAGNSLFFHVRQPSYEYQPVVLWRSDGTPAGTGAVGQTTVGSLMDFRNTDIVSFNGSAYFASTDESHGLELWKAGAAGAAALVADVNPEPVPAGFFDDCQLGATRLFFVSNGVRGYELWRTDGTPAGTGLVKLPYARTTWVTFLAANESVAYFTANDGINGGRLWRTDGTAAGTVEVSSTHNVSSASNRNAALIGNVLYFTADLYPYGYELFRTDGTPGGTALVKDINPGPSGYAYPDQFRVIGQTLYFFADDGTHGTELWRTDGTAAGTSMVKDISGKSYSKNGRDAVVTRDGLLLFIGDDEEHGPEVWRSDGTAAGTYLLADANPGVGGLGDYLDSPVFLAGDRYTYFKSSLAGPYLWRTDGTPGGTMPLEYAPGGPSNFGHLISAGDTLYFATDEGAPSYGTSVWRLDPKAATPALLLDGTVAGLTNFFYFTQALGNLYFTARHSIDGEELWWTDAGAQSTTAVRVTDLAGDFAGASIFNVSGYGDRLFFTLRSTDGDVQLYTLAVTPRLAPTIKAPTGAIAAATPVTFSGTAPSGVRVELVVDGVAVGTSRTDALGNWSVRIGAGFSAGAHSVAARILGAESAGPLSLAHDFTAAATTVDPDPPDPTAPSVTVQSVSVPAIDGAGWTITLVFSDASGLDPASVGAGDVLITGPRSFSGAATLVSYAGGTAVYRVAAPGGYFDPADNGAYTLSVPGGAVTDTAGNGNVAAAVPLSVELAAPGAGADLVGMIMTVPVSVAPGSKVNAVTVKVTNVGTRAFAGRVTVRLHALPAAAEVFDPAGAVALGSGVVSASLSLNASRTAVVTFKPPASLPAGSGAYRIFAALDTGKAVEQYKGNNVARAAKTTKFVVPSADLAVSVKAFPGTMGTAKAPVFVTVTNKGNTAAVGPATVGLFASDDKVLDASLDALLGKVTQRLNLKPGATVTFSVRGISPAGLKGVSRYLAAAVTYTGKPADPVAGNNTVFSKARVKFA